MRREGPKIVLINDFFSYSALERQVTENLEPVSPIIIAYLVLQLIFFNKYT